MIYSVVPRELADELYPKLLAYYENDENVTVIVDRRTSDRRSRGRRSEAGVPNGAAQRRIVRDRRRARVPGDMPPLARARS
jgi:hypothetical protein